MDEQKCILYFHGGKLSPCLNSPIALAPLPYLFSAGGYYFGSVNQQRGSIQRIARKTNGRVFGKYFPVALFIPYFTTHLSRVILPRPPPCVCVNLTPISPAIDYRLSPQYPFPCAIQDALAAYLYLIQPPAGAKHTPVKPENIVIMGNSAGGGLALAVLQVIRDSGLQRCAGGVLVSPWCDLSHSFPSIIKNTETVGPRASTCLVKLRAYS